MLRMGHNERSIRGFHVPSRLQKFVKPNFDSSVKVETYVPRQRRVYLVGHSLTDLHSRGVDIKLPEDGEGLLEELVADGDVCDVRGVVVIQTVDVLHDACPVGFDGRQDKKVLEVSERKHEDCENLGKHPAIFSEMTGNYSHSPVLAEDGVIQDDLLQQLDQLIGEVGSHEGLDCDRHFLWVLSLRQGRLHHLQAVKGYSKVRRGR